MIRDKRRHEAPEDRRNYEDRLNKQEARAEQLFYASTPTMREGKSVSFELAAAMMRVKEELGDLAAAIESSGVPRSGQIVRGVSGSYFYMDEFTAKKVPDYVADTSWDGWKPEPDDLRGKKKKRWHSTQYKAYKQWKAEEELRAAVEAELIGEARTDLGWGGF